MGRRASRAPSILGTKKQLGVSTKRHPFDGRIVVNLGRTAHDRSEESPLSRRFPLRRLPDYRRPPGWRLRAGGNEAKSMPIVGQRNPESREPARGFLPPGPR